MQMTAVLIAYRPVKRATAHRICDVRAAHGLMRGSEKMCVDGAARSAGMALVFVPLNLYD